MVDCTFITVRILFIFCCCLTVHCAQPNCTSVTDFDDCPGNVTGFCPENIVCACKDGNPFCKCPNFRGRWGNYWYMGAKCEQIWNTRDLVLVAALPAIGLALIVGVTMQTVHYCKQKSKNIQNHREHKNVSELQPQHNSAYINDIDMRPSQATQGQNPWSPYPQSVIPRIPVSSPPQLSGRKNNSVFHEPKQNNNYNYPPYNWDDSLGTAGPEGNYGYKSSNMHMKPPYHSSTPGFPNSSYIQRERQFGHQIPEDGEIPYRTGRPQMKSNY